ncbi:ABC transporter permease [uncultured Tyzzerella sp.]|uniref:ABC transporter permease n=1 Tax=uncultured Tyzzerella sp. TaxID=2321398 RepID=UPI002943AF8F|nr:ABC transporter permease [uncultured Tyzzerella sp.]
MKNKLYWLLLVPGIILLVFFLVIPILNTLFPTVYDNGFTLSKYIEFFRDEYYLSILIRTLKISIISTIVCVLLGTPTAYYISRCDKKWRSLLIAISIFPLLTNSVVRSFAWINILGKKGVINTMLMKIGLIEEPLTLLYTEFSIIIGTIYLFLPLMIITVVGVMENIDNDMMEAAESLGANRITAFFKVVLPMSLPGIIVGSVLVFTGALTAYTTPQLLGGNKNLVLATFIQQQAMSVGDWTGASVIATIMIIITVLVIKILNMISSKLDKRGED